MRIFEIRYVLLLLVVVAVSVAGVSCTGRDFSEDDAEIRVGFSQPTTNDLWRVSMNEEMLRYSAVYPNMSLEIRDGRSSNEKQIRDIEYFIEQEVDVLIVSPNEADPIQPVIEKAYQKGIHVILIDRKVKSDQFTSFIGADNFEVGYQAGIYARVLLKNEGKILEISGLAGSTPAQERHQGFIEGVDTASNNIKIVDGGDGQWIESPTKKLVRRAHETHGAFDLVFAHNDVMAVAAHSVAEQDGWADETEFIGVDALPGEFGGVQKVIDGVLTGTLLYPTGGREAIETAYSLASGNEVPDNITLETSLITDENAEIYLLQTEKIDEQQELIETQQNAIDEQVIRFESQRSWLIFTIGLLFVLIVILFFLYRAYKYINRINSHLEQKNLSITRQKNEILKMSERIKQFTAEKIEFFTFISHEFRTPIAIMSSLMYRVRANGDGISQNQIGILEKNIKRLNSLVDQVLDFRKFEENKMDLNNEPLNVKDFITSIIEGFSQFADKKIKLNLSYSLSPVVLIDRDKFEKVLTNLISNAVKFTSNEGHIDVDVSVNYSILTISVTDNGIGIPREKYEEVFKPFFSTSSKNSRYYTKGTGIGLNLVKQIVELYNGDITVESEEGKGTTFTCELNVKVLDEQVLLEKQKDNQPEDVETDEKNATEEIKKIKKIDKNAPTLLVIEDNADLNNEIEALFQDNGYNVFTAFDGKQGIDLARKVRPDLVVTDLVMPDVSGFEVAETLKNDENIGNIPIVMLTAMTDMEMKKKGYESGVDDYITKPFPPDMLLSKVDNVLATRSRFKKSIEDQYGDWVKASVKEMDPESQNFLNKLRKLIEDHISDSDLNVNMLAEELNMSRTTLYNKVKELLDLTPIELIKKFRISYARTLLEDTDLNMSEVAYKAGFQNTSYFSKVFKSSFNITPTQYAAKHKKMNISKHL